MNETERNEEAKRHEDEALIKAALVRLKLIAVLTEGIEVRPIEGQADAEFVVTARGELLIDIMLKDATMQALYDRCVATGHEPGVARIALMVDGVASAIRLGRLHELEAIGA